MRNRNEIGCLKISHHLQTRIMGLLVKIPGYENVISNQLFSVIEIANSGWYGLEMPDGRVAFISPKMVEFQAD